MIVTSIIAFDDIPRSAIVAQPTVKSLMVSQLVSSYGHRHVFLGGGTPRKYSACSLIQDVIPKNLIYKQMENKLRKCDGVFSLRIGNVTRSLIAGPITSVLQDFSCLRFESSHKVNYVIEHENGNLSGRKSKLGFPEVTAADSTHCSCDIRNP